MALRCADQLRLLRPEQREHGALRIAALNDPQAAGNFHRRELWAVFLLAASTAADARAARVEIAVAGSASGCSALFYAEVHTAGHRSAGLRTSVLTDDIQPKAQTRAKLRMRVRLTARSHGCFTAMQNKAQGKKKPRRSRVTPG